MPKLVLNKDGQIIDRETGAAEASAKKTIEKTAKQVPAKSKDVEKRHKEYSEFYGAIERHLYLAMEECDEE